MTAKLQPPDSHHLTAAQGWLELGNYAEAFAELDNVIANLEVMRQPLQDGEVTISCASGSLTFPARWPTSEAASPSVPTTS